MSHRDSRPSPSNTNITTNVAKETNVNGQSRLLQHDVNGDTKVRLLFLNTRSALGADVAVHMTLIQNFDPNSVDLSVATNRNSRDHRQIIDILQASPALNAPATSRGEARKRLLVLNLGHEVSRAGGGKLGKIKGILSNLPVLFSLVRIGLFIKKHKIQVIHSTDRPRDALFASLLARITGCRNVMHVHIKWDRGIGKAAQWAVNQCAGVIAISDFTRRSILDGGIPANKVYTCLNSCDPVRFSPTITRPGLLRERFQIAPDTPVIGMVARIIMWKGHLELVEALQRVRAAIPNVKLIIVGEEDPLIANTSDSFEAKVRQRIRELGIEECVYWAGWQDDMPRVMLDFDLLAVPSWEEPFGLVCIEGMAMQRPIVGFDAGALPEIFTDGVEGRLVPVRDSIKLADALVELLKNPALRATMGQRGRDRVEAYFTPGRQADEMVDIYRKITTQHL